MSDGPFFQTRTREHIIMAWHFLFGQIRITIQHADSHPDTYDLAL